MRTCWSCSAQAWRSSADQLVGVPGFGQVAVDPAAVDGFDHRLDVGVAGEQDADGLGTKVRDRASSSTPVMVGMRWSVRMTWIGCSCSTLSSVGPALGSVDLEIPAQQRTQREQDLGLVVHHQDGRPALCHRLLPHWGEFAVSRRHALAASGSPDPEQAAPVHLALDLNGPAVVADDAETDREPRSRSPGPPVWW